MVLGSSPVAVTSLGCNDFLDGIIVIFAYVYVCVYKFVYLCLCVWEWEGLCIKDLYVGAWVEDFCVVHIFCMIQNFCVVYKWVLVLLSNFWSGHKVSTREQIFTVNWLNVPGLLLVCVQSIEMTFVRKKIFFFILLFTFFSFFCLFSNLPSIFCSILVEILCVDCGGNSNFLSWFEDLSRGLQKLIYCWKHST